MRRDRSTYLVDTDGMAPDERALAVRTVMEVVAGSADRYECDIPLANQDAWPADVRAAARTLAGLRRPRRSENEHYRQTGVRRRADDAAAWESFTTFAAYAFDASVWDAHGAHLVSLADEGTSVVVELTEAEAATLVGLVPLTRLLD